MQSSQSVMLLRLRVHPHLETDHLPVHYHGLALPTHLYLCFPHERCLVWQCLDGRDVAISIGIGDSELCLIKLQ